MDYIKTVLKTIKDLGVTLVVDGDNIKANFKDGLLSIEIPKIEPEKPKIKSVKIS